MPRFFDLNYAAVGHDERAEREARFGSFDAALEREAGEGLNRDPLLILIELEDEFDEIE